MCYITAVSNYESPGRDRLAGSLSMFRPTACVSLHLVYAVRL